MIDPPNIEEIVAVACAHRAQKGDRIDVVTAKADARNRYNRLTASQRQDADLVCDEIEFAIRAATVNEPWPSFKWLDGDWRIMDIEDGMTVPRVLIQETQTKRWVPTTVTD